MNLQSKIRDKILSLEDTLKGAFPLAALGLALLAGYVGFNAYLNRTPKIEPERAPIVDTSDYDFYAPVRGGDEYNEDREIRSQLPLKDRLDLIFNDDHMFDFDFPASRGMPELRSAPEKEPSKPIYQKSPVKAYVGNKLVNHKVKNNNPMNLKVVYHYDKKGRRFMIPWAGQIDVDRRGFAIFKNELYGLRSWLKNARDLRDRYGTDTVSELITKCSPPHENDTNSYINFVAENIGLAPNEKLDFTNREQMVGLMASVTQKESSAQYPRHMLEKAYAMLPK